MRIVYPVPGRELPISLSCRRGRLAPRGTIGRRDGVYGVLRKGRSVSHAPAYCITAVRFRTLSCQLPHGQPLPHPRSGGLSPSMRRPAESAGLSPPFQASGAVHDLKDPASRHPHHTHISNASGLTKTARAVSAVPDHSIPYSGRTRARSRPCMP